MILSTFGKVFTRLRASRRAGLALMTGLALPFLIGAAGFATDSAFWFAQHSALQSAVDAGALAVARDLETTPGGPTAPDAITTAITTDAVNAANAASSNQFGLTAASLNIQTLGAASQGGDPRRVQVDASAPAKLFFSPAVHMGKFTISTRAVAGVSYSLISTQATCQALDSFTYIYSTGFGTLETAHSSGIDPYTCGQAAIVPPLPNTAYCNGGILGCSLSLVTTPLGLNVGGSLLPIAFQVEPNGAGGGGLVPTLTSALATIPSLLGGMTSTSTAAPKTYLKGQCAQNICNIPAGVYPGGIVIGPGVTFNFVAGSGGNTYFLLLNGNLVISTQAAIQGTAANNFTFFMLGATPGAYVSENQVQVNLAPIAQGAITYTSAASFNYQSVLGTQISAPYSEMFYAQQQAASPSAGLVGNLGLPGGNVVGTNYVTVMAVCPQATSFCTPSYSRTAAQYQTTLLPSASGVVQVLANLLGQNTPVSSLSSQLLSNAGEQSTTTFVSGVQIANGIPTDWSQSEAQTGTQSATTQPLAYALSGVNQVLTGLLNLLGLGGLNSAVTDVYKTITQGQPQLTNTAPISGSGVFPNQVTQLPSSSSTAGCSAGATNLYTGVANIQPNFGPAFTNLVITSGTQNPQKLALTTTDTILICGTTSSATTIAQIFPGQTGMTGSAAAGASTLALLQ